jgi:hypothetical protein
MKNPLNQKAFARLRMLVAMLCVSTSSLAADLSISGPAEVCPEQTYSFTASASNIFGPRAGSFGWSVWRNGVMIQALSAADCDPASNSQSSSTMSITFDNNLGMVNIKVQFHGYNDPGCGISTQWYNVNVRVLAPASIADANGELTICPGGTRTFYVPPVPNNLSGCYWHYALDYVVPSGWTVVPADGSGYTVIAGGIRTHAFSVNITSPSNAQAGATGNYMITVSTEPLWPWPKSVSRQFWVGKPAWGGFTYDGEMTPVVCEGLYQSFTSGDHVLSAVPNGTINNPSFVLQTSSPHVHGTPVGTNYNFWVNPKNMNFEFLIHTSVSNVCGTLSACTYFTNWASLVAEPYPNPSDKELRVSLGKEGSTKNVQLFNGRQGLVFSAETRDKDIVINTTELPAGTYVLKVTGPEKSASKHLHIKH